MSITTIQIFLAAATIMAALAVGLVCAVGLVVWLAGGQLAADKRSKMI
jgi:nitrate reductase NapE component